MAEFQSSLTSRLTPGIYGAAAAPSPLTLSERSLGHFFQIAGWPDNFGGKVDPVLTALGFSELGPVGVAQEAGSHCLFRVGPERLLIHSDSPAAWELTTGAADTRSITLLDLSHARTIVRIEGPAACDLLMRLVSLDLDKNVFREGRFALTGINAVPVMLHRLAAEIRSPIYDLFIPYSWAASLWDLICKASQPFGYQVSKRS